MRASGSVLALALAGLGLSGSCKPEAPELLPDDSSRIGHSDAFSRRGPRDATEKAPSYAAEADLPPCAASAPGAMMGCVRRSRYATDLKFIAHPRAPGSTHWKAIQDLCSETLTGLGFEVERHKYASGVNVVGTKPGTKAPKERVVLGAHYDHIASCPGADDNATGVAALLEAARVLGTTKYERTLVVACWDEEERGLLGSAAYAHRVRKNGENVVLSISLDAIGYTRSLPGAQQLPAGFDVLYPEQVAALGQREFRADFIAVIADDLASKHADRIQVHAHELGLSAVILEVDAASKHAPTHAQLRRSDHASFWDVDLPAILITDTGDFRNPNYHCQEGTDTIKTLNHAFTASVLRATIAATAEALRIAG